LLSLTRYIQIIIANSFYFDYSSKSCKQIIIEKHNHNPMITINPSSSVIIYVMTATNKRLLISESHDDSNRCTPCRGKPNQHTTYDSHSSPCTPGVHFLRAVSVRDNISLAPTKLKQAPTPERSLGNQRQTGPVVVLGGLIPPPMRQPWNRGKNFWPNGYTATSAY
jgi:hypothetical protein